MLFEFSDEYIAELCAGLSDADTLGLFQRALAAGQDIVQERVSSFSGKNVYLDPAESSWVVDLDGQEAAREFGVPGRPADAQFGAAFANSVHDARNAIEAVLNARD